jgi:hypothetical protein
MGARWAHPQLKELVVEASRALARLDVARLEELALSCRVLSRDLSRDLTLVDGDLRRELACQAGEAKEDMAVFARVLAATRENLNVMNRLRELRTGRLEYGRVEARAWARTESGHGDN